MKSDVAAADARDLVNRCRTSRQRGTTGPAADVEIMTARSRIGEVSERDSREDDRAASVGIAELGVGQREVGVLGGNDRVGPSPAGDLRGARPAADVERVVADPAIQFRRLDRGQRDCAEPRDGQGCARKGHVLIGRDVDHIRACSSIDRGRKDGGIRDIERVVTPLAVEVTWPNRRENGDTRAVDGESGRND